MLLSPRRLQREKLASSLDSIHRLPYTLRYHHSACLNFSKPNFTRFGFSSRNIKDKCNTARNFSYSSSHLRFASDEAFSLLESSAFHHWFKNWQEKRKYKLTASTFGSAIGFWPRRRVQLWLEKIGAIKPFSGNLATCWNNIKEQEALERYKLITGNAVSFPEFQIYRERNPGNDWLAASPDGIVDRNAYELPSKGVLEIKCPFYNGDKSRMIPWRRIPLYYVPQAQGLMEIMDKDWLELYVWTPRGSSLFRMGRDEEYWLALEMALSDFWWKHVQPAKEVCQKSVITHPLWQLRDVAPKPRHELCRYIVYESKRIVDNSELLMREIDGKLII